MTTLTILISPKGYDDANAILQRLGGTLANTRQLDEADIEKIGDHGYLSRFEHLFLNCHGMFGSSRSVSPSVSGAVRDFAHSGGSLYVSDWASAVIEAAFGELAVFSPRNGVAGSVRARVSDPYLIQKVGREMSINFDMPGWTLIERFPASAAVYLWDVDRRPLAVGFRVGRGRIVFTSFHHHAQHTGPQPLAEETLLQWLITLPTQHRHMVSVGATLAEHRGTVRGEVVSQIGSDRQVIPSKLGRKSGLGVFALAWDPDDRVEFSMRFLRGEESVDAEESSSTPPLVMRVRNPKDDDAVEVRRHILPGSGGTMDAAQPYVFAEAIRRDLIGDPDWFASAVARHLLGSLEGEATFRTAREHLTTDRVQQTIVTILDGLGYVTSLHRGEDREGEWMEVRAFTSETEGEVPAIRIGVKVVERTAIPDYTDGLDYTHGVKPSPIRGAFIPGAEHLVVSVALSGGSEIEPSGGETERTAAMTDPSSESTVWRAVASESVPLAHEQAVVTAQEFSEGRHIDVVVYRAEDFSGRM